MCGIVYQLNINGTPVNKDIARQYQAQRHRGTEGFGFATINNGQVTVMRAVDERKIMKYLKKNPSNEIIFHHRWPTSTQNTIKGAHPISTNEQYKSRYYLVHNGIIWNDEELYQKHRKIGLHYSTLHKWNATYNDSEVLLHELARYLEGIDTTIHAEGSVAFILIETDKATNRAKALHFGRNAGNPLNIYVDENTLMLSSEGKGLPLKEDTLYTYDYATKQVTNRPLVISQGTIPKYKYTDTTNDVPMVDEWIAQGDTEQLEQSLVLAGTLRKHYLVELEKAHDEHDQLKIQDMANQLAENEEYISAVKMELDFRFAQSIGNV